MKKDLELSKVEKTLNLLPSVLWDRYIKEKDLFIVYGWLPRADSYKDFIILFFKDNMLASFLTSSKESQTLLLTLGLATPHATCQRVEDLLTNVHAVKLERDK